MNRTQFHAVALTFRRAIADAEAGKQPGWDRVLDLAHQLTIAAIGYRDDRTETYATAIACYVQRRSGVCFDVFNQRPTT